MAHAKKEVKKKKKKKRRAVCLAKLLLKFIIPLFKEALKLAILYILYLNIKKNDYSVGHFALKWRNVVRNRWPG